MPPAHMRIDTIASVSACPAQKCLRLALAAGRIDDIEGLIGDTIPNRVEVLDLAAYCPVTLHEFGVRDAIVHKDGALPPSSMSALVGRQDCKIVRLLPIEDGKCLYRIKCVDEDVERVVQEGHLAIRPLRQ